MPVKAVQAAPTADLHPQNVPTAPPPPDRPQQRQSRCAAGSSRHGWRACRYQVAAPISRGLQQACAAVARKPAQHHLRLPGQPELHCQLGQSPGVKAPGTVSLKEVLARPSAATNWHARPVGIDHQLIARQAVISFRATHLKGTSTVNRQLQGQFIRQPGQLLCGLCQRHLQGHARHWQLPSIDRQRVQVHRAGSQAVGTDWGNLTSTPTARQLTALKHWLVT